MSRAESNDLHRRARRHLSRRDPVLKGLMKIVGPCVMRQDPDRFLALVRSIISQQISTKAADSIRGRLEQLLHPRPLAPKTILAASEEVLQQAGLSNAKRRSLRDLAEKVHSRTVPLDMLHEFDDEEVIARLIPVRGIGRWTAQMFLIFSLGRPDVLPVADLGLRAGVRRHYGLAELPEAEELTELAEPWKPYRSIATWYIWRSL